MFIYSFYFFYFSIVLLAFLYVLYCLNTMHNNKKKSLLITECLCVRLINIKGQHDHFFPQFNKKVNIMVRFLLLLTTTHFHGGDVSYFRMERMSNLRPWGERVT